MSYFCWGAGVEREEVPHYAEGSQFLKSIGFQNVSEISRVLDIAMNPNSLYMKDRHKRRSVNVNVCSTLLLKESASHVASDVSDIIAVQ